MGNILKISDVSLLHKIGVGAFGEVWIAKDLVGHYQAAKIIFTRNDAQVQISDKEWKGLENYQALSRSHSELLTIYRIGKNESFVYYLMELADPVAPNWHACGKDYQPKTLRQILGKYERLTKKDCLEFAIHLTKGLDLFHQRGLIHRDIKPSNIVFVDGKPKLADIGLVRSIQDELSFAGTEGYMPPEGARTKQSDIYSLGMVFYQMLTGNQVTEFPKLSVPDSKNKIDRKFFVEFNTIVSKCTHPIPSERYQTANQILDDLNYLQKGASIRTRDYTRKLAKRTGILVLLGLLALLAAKFFEFSQSDSLPLTKAVLFDDFEGEIINSAAWKANRPFPFSKVEQSQGSLKLKSRGQIVTKVDNPPNFEMTGSFILKHPEDVIKICIRTTGNYVDEKFAELNGIKIEFFAQGHVSVLPLGITAKFNFPIQEPINFKIRDLNDLVSVFLENEENPAIEISTPIRAGGKIGIYNREFPNLESIIDYIQIKEFQTGEKHFANRFEVKGLSDDFDGPTISTNQWEINEPWADSTATSNNGYLKLENGAALLSRNQILPPWSLSGRFRFVGNPEDSFKILFRFKDLIDANKKSKFCSVQFNIYGNHHKKGFGNVMLITNEGMAALGSHPIELNEWINFEIKDEGKLLFVYVDQSKQPLIIAKSENTYGNRIGLQNRHGKAAGSFISAGSKVEVDFINVKTLNNTIPPPDKEEVSR